MKQTASLRILRPTGVAVLALAASCLFGAPLATAQSSSTTAPAASAPQTTAAPGTKAATASSALALQESVVTKYDNRWDIYGGLLLMNGQAGQNLPKRYNMGGVEVLGTYWLPAIVHIPSNHLGIAADYRIGAGTSPVLPQADVYGFNRILVYQNIVSGGLEYRGPKNRYVGINFQALAGATHGTFDTAITGYPHNNPTQPYPTTGFVGVYSNRTSAWGAAGGSIDFNYSPKVAIRMQPDLTFEHFGTETREFFSLSMGLVYRLGKIKE